jgi:hypothetical protein
MPARRLATNQVGTSQPTRQKGVFVRFLKAMIYLEYMNKGDAVTKPGKPEDVEEQLPEWLR